MKTLIQALVILILSATNVKAADPAKQEPAPVINTAAPVWTMHPMGQQNKLELTNNGTEPLQLTVTDKRGNIVHKASIRNNRQSVSFRTLDTGNYNLTIEGADRSETIKLIIL